MLRHVGFLAFVCRNGEPKDADSLFPLEFIIMRFENDTGFLYCPPQFEQAEEKA